MNPPISTSFQLSLWPPRNSSHCSPAWAPWCSSTTRLLSVHFPSSLGELGAATSHQGTCLTSTSHTQRYYIQFSCTARQPRPPTQKHVAGDKVLTCICNTMLYSGLMIQHFSTWVDVKNKFESQAVRLISTSYILEIDSSLFQMTLNLR